MPDCFFDEAGLQFEIIQGLAGELNCMAAEKFETSLKKLEEVVRKLEGGSLSLDDSIKAFEEGVRHSAFCAKKLDEAERKVELLIKQRDGSFSKEPFLAADDEE